MPSRSSNLQIQAEEWDFREVPRDRVGEALVYEYCRSERWITDLVRDCTEDIGDSTKYQIPATDLYAVKRKVRLKPADIGREVQERPDEEEGSSALVPVVEIWARRTPRKNPFLNHDRVITLSAGFPERPYLENSEAFASIRIREGISLPGVYDLESISVEVRPRKDATIWNYHDSPFRGKISWEASEPNGLPIALSRDDPFWRKFALAIDISRTDEELERSFKDFIKEARVKYNIPLPSTSERLTRNAMPSWITERFCQDSLNALGAHRLIRCFAGDEKAAFQFAKAQLEIRQGNNRRKNWTFAYGTTKEFRRAAKKYETAAVRLFGKFGHAG